MSNIMNIGNIYIGDEFKPLVIPEIGINHNGNLKVAKDLVFSAYKAGARLIKHQTHVVEDEMSEAARKVIPGNASVSIYEIMDNASLSADEEYELMKYTESLGMEFLSTPFSRAAANRLQEFGVKAFKIGSGEMNNLPLIEHIAAFGKPMIVSTGMNNMTSIRRVVSILERKRIDYALLHTTNLYPTQPNQVRLGAMKEMMINFPQAVVGLSDHTVNNNACIAAISMGAKIVERHYTDNMDRIGPDIVCSMDELRLRELIEAANEIPQMFGGKKEPLEEEQVTINFAFASVVAIKNIKKGEIFSKDNIWVKRPGTGEIPACDFESLLGKKANKDIAVDTQISKVMYE